MAIYNFMEVPDTEAAADEFARVSRVLGDKTSFFTGPPDQAFDSVGGFHAELLHPFWCRFGSRRWRKGQGFDGSARSLSARDGVYGIAAFRPKPLTCGNGPGVRAARKP